MIIRDEKKITSYPLKNALAIETHILVGVVEVHGTARST